MLFLDDYESIEAFGNAIVDQKSARLEDLDASAKVVSNVACITAPAVVLCPCEAFAPTPSHLIHRLSDAQQNRASQRRFNGAATDAESLSRSVETNLDTRKLVNVVIAKDFNLAPKGIQIQGLEVRGLLNYIALR